MDNNVSFTRDLEISYLFLLAEKDYRDEFIERFADVGPMINANIDTIVDQRLLTCLKSIIDYKKRIEMRMSK